MRKDDDGKRPLNAVAVSIARDGEGLLRIMFDELQLSDEKDHDRTWRHATFVTSAIIAETKLESFSFTSEELDGFAHLMLGMLKVALDRRR